jgi:hypothetical protein
MFAVFVSVSSFGCFDIPGVFPFCFVRQVFRPASIFAIVLFTKKIRIFAVLLNWRMNKEVKISSSKHAIVRIISKLDIFLK